MRATTSFFKFFSATLPRFAKPASSRTPPRADRPLLPAAHLPPPPVMPKSKRPRVVDLSKVNKKTRQEKEKLFNVVRAAVNDYQHCFVFSIVNMRNSYLKDVRRELSDSRLFFGKIKLMVKALGTTPEEAAAPGIDALANRLRGGIGLILTNRNPEEVIDYFDRLAKVDFARSGAMASRTFTVPPGVVYSTAGEVPPENDVLLEASLEPELRRLGVPTRLIKGKIVLGDESGEGEGYVVCKEGQILDSRQTRLLKLFSVCLSEFRVKALCYWSASTGKVTDIEQPALNTAEETAMESADESS